MAYNPEIIRMPSYGVQAMVSGAQSLSQAVQNAKDRAAQREYREQLKEQQGLAHERWKSEQEAKREMMRKKAREEVRKAVMAGDYEKARFVAENSGIDFDLAAEPQEPAEAPFEGGPGGPEQAADEAMSAVRSLPGGPPQGAPPRPPQGPAAQQGPPPQHGAESDVAWATQQGGGTPMPQKAPQAPMRRPQPQPQTAAPQQQGASRPPLDVWARRLGIVPQTAQAAQQELAPPRVVPVIDGIPFDREQAMAQRGQVIMEKYKPLVLAMEDPADQQVMAALVQGAAKSGNEAMVKELDGIQALMQNHRTRGMAMDRVKELRRMAEDERDFAASQERESRIAGSTGQKDLTQVLKRGDHLTYVNSLKRLQDARNKIASGNKMANLLGAYDVALMNNERVTDKDFEIALGVTGLAEVIESSADNNAKALLRMLRKSVDEGDQEETGVLARKLRGALSSLIPESEDKGMYTESKKKQILEGLDVVGEDLQQRTEIAWRAAQEYIDDSPTDEVREGREAAAKALFRGTGMLGDSIEMRGAEAGGESGGSGGSEASGAEPGRGVLSQNVDLTPVNEDRLAKADRRGRKFRPIIEREAKKRGINPEVAYHLMLAESGGSMGAEHSGTGAVGLFQIYPNAHPNYDFERMKEDPRYAISAGLDIFANKLKKAGGDYAKALTRWGGDTMKDGRLGNYLENISGVLPENVRNFIRENSEGGGRPKRQAVEGQVMTPEGVAVPEDNDELMDEIRSLTGGGGMM